MTVQKIRISPLFLILLAWVFNTYAAGENHLTLRVSRDFHSPPLIEKRAKCANQSVMKLLKECATIGTAFGGEFVQSINGIAAGKGRDAQRAWLYYVNGMIADVGATQYVPKCGDYVVWDLHKCNGAVTVPSLIGCFPQPFASFRKPGATPLLILHDDPSKETACMLARSLEQRGCGKAKVQSISGSPLAGDVPCIIVGQWSNIIGNPTINQMYDHRKACGIFAEFDKDGLQVLSLDRSQRKSLPSAGVILATKRGCSPPLPLWIVSGTDHEQTTKAAEILIDEPEKIRGMASAAISGGRIYPVPLMDAADNHISETTSRRAPVRGRDG
jgi:hypothetical protein